MLALALVVVPLLLVMLTIGLVQWRRERPGGFGSWDDRSWKRRAHRHHVPHEDARASVYTHRRSVM